MRRVVVGYSGGVTSAWCAAWALDNFPKDEVIFLFHDTKEEHKDTYRFIYELAEKLGHPITEQSDGRSVTEVIYDENCLPNNRMAFCSRILKAEQRDIYFKLLRESGVSEIINVLGFTALETQRVQRTFARGLQAGYTCRYPLIENNTTKQDCADWCNSIGVKPSEMYRWSEHANCVACARGGKAYFLKVHEQEPVAFYQRSSLEDEFGHTFLKDTTLKGLLRTGLKRKVAQRESIDIGPCEC